MLDERHSQFISRIYDLPLRPEKWPDVLDEFAPFMNAKAGAVVALDPIYAEHRLQMMSSHYFRMGDETKMLEFNERFGEAEKEGYEVPLDL